ncbi:ketopantoate reductase family protein [Muricoccus radiodurans]|uniref:ketopantoate reductase family protein n=1 Tax=Muricoccus radiodurans TaxID=2231721 RepID=UPI003CEAF2CF
MRICIFGAGAIGGHLAVRLAQGGAEVSVIARGAYLDGIRADGLTITAPDGTFHARPAATDDPASLGPQDAVIVTVKGPALGSVAAAIGPLLGPVTPVAFVMNGIPWWYFDRHGGPMDGKRLPALDPGDAVRRAVGVERTIGGVVYSACTVTKPGHIFVEHARNRVVLGELDGRISDRAEALAAALRAGGISSPVVPDIRKAVWEKLIANIGSGPLCVVARQGIAGVLADPAIRAAAAANLREAAAIAGGLGIPIEMDPEARLKVSETIAHKPSILQDLEAGKPMELEAIFLQPLALARMAGVATPSLDLSVALARKAAEAAGLYAPT